MAQCPKCELFSTDPLMAAWEATYQHEDGCSYDPRDDDDDDDGYRFDPVEGESRIRELS